MQLIYTVECCYLQEYITAGTMTVKKHPNTVYITHIPERACHMILHHMARALRYDDEV